MAPKKGSALSGYCACRPLYCILLAVLLFTVAIVSFLLTHIDAPARGNLSLLKKHVSISPTFIPKVKPVPRKRYAFAITITKDGFFLDGAAVLAYSIMKYSYLANYSISFVAFVHPNVSIARPGLTKLGFHVIEVPIPVNRTAIQFEFLREKIDKNGCCGSSELIKLTSYRLLQYDRVIHLDADVMLLNVSAFNYL